MEVLFALLLFCKSLWVDKYTGETISSILLAHQVKTALVFLGGGWGAEKLCSLRLCIALSTVLCASRVAQKSVAVPGLLDARTCCTFWCNSLHFDSCCCSQLEMEAGRNGLVEGMAGGNGSSWLLGLCLRGEGGECSTEWALFCVTVLIADPWKSCSTPARARYGLGTEAALETWPVTLDKENFTQNFECLRA